MILGPNGTGKSTLVCAICLGLGGSPNLLGRAKNIGEFVKEGTREGKITIELKSDPGERNLILSRRIGVDNSNSWYIYGKEVRAKLYSQELSRFNIQIDNLCQFLPQDKVHEFAEMSPQQLLIATEQAIGSETLYPNHLKLIDLSQKQARLAEPLEKDKEHLEELKKKVEAQEQQMVQIQLIHETQRELDLLKACVPFSTYRAAASAATEMKHLVKECKERRRAVVQQNLSLNQSKSASEEQLEKSNLQLEQNLNECSEFEEGIRQRIKNIATLSVSVPEKRQNINALSKIESRHLEAMAQLKDLERQRQRLMDASDGDIERKQQLLTEIRDLKRQLREIGNDKIELSQKSEALKRDIDRNKLEKLQKETILKNMDSIAERKLNLLKRVDNNSGPIAAKAVEILRANPQWFDNKVYEPPALSVNLLDPSCRSQVVASLGKNTLMTFICQNRKDYITFSKRIIDEHNLSVNLVEFSGSPKKTVADHQKPCSVEKLRSLGFDGFMIDLLDGPEPVLNALCHMSSIHSVPYAKRPLSALQGQNVNNLINSNGDPVIKRYVDSTSVAQLTRSVYGARKVTVRIIPIRDNGPQFFSNSSVESNPEEKNLLTAQIQEIEGNVRRTEQIVEDAIQERSQLNESQNKIRSQTEDIEVKIKDIDVKKKSLMRLDAEITSQKKTLARQEQEADQFEEKMKTCKLEMDELLEKIATESSLVSEELPMIVEKRKNLMILKLSCRTYENHLSQTTRYIKSVLEPLNEEMEELEDRYNSLKEDANKLKAELVGISKTHSTEVKNQIRQIVDDPENTVEFLNEKIASLSARLELGGNTNSASLKKQYDDNLKALNTLMERVERDDQARENITEQIEALRTNWEKELRSHIDTVSEKFSEAFQSIGCKGQVRLGVNDSAFDKWSIDILVSFRGNSGLQILDHRRQSGGERSVSTIFYLMSLQGLAKAPFRVVDEINQGMDPRNERIVHCRLVEVACRENTSQYFLLTPKLLPDLNYDPRMKLHFIFSGNGVQNSKRSSQLGSIERTVALAKRLKLTETYAYE